VTLQLAGGAGGPAGLPADYEYGDHREPYREAGLWGEFSVRCPGGLPIRPVGGVHLPAGAGCGGSRLSVARWPAGALLVAAGLIVLVARRRRRRPAGSTGGVPGVSQI
jgi:hypothetical protein